MRVSEPLRERPPCDVLLTANTPAGLVGLEARCYAVVPPYVYVHLADPALVHDSPPRCPVLLTAGPEHSPEWRFLDAAWGFLERVDDRELAPHCLQSDSTAPIWRVHLDGGARAAIGWSAAPGGEAAYGSGDAAPSTSGSGSSGSRSPGRFISST